MTTLPAPLQALALLLAILAIGHDLYARRIPNTVLLGILVVAVAWQGIVLAGWMPASVPGLANGSLALVLALAAMLPFYALGWMGAGDVKMMAVLGFLLGWKGLLAVWLAANVLVIMQTALIFAGRFLMKRQPQLALLQANWQQSDLYQFIQKPRQGRHGMPFAAYLGIGVFICVFFPLPGVLS